ncbi:MAG: hypothetical protein IT290_07205 [Deltaproteobacteria bacterium]|nr:hypothetical protein [Deltaproteobacteria bacterium]
MDIDVIEGVVARSTNLRPSTRRDGCRRSVLARVLTAGTLRLQCQSRLRGKRSIPVSELARAEIVFGASGFRRRELRICLDGGCTDDSEIRLVVREIGVREIKVRELAAPSVEAEVRASGQNSEERVSTRVIL